LTHVEAVAQSGSPLSDWLCDVAERCWEREPARLTAAGDAPLLTDGEVLTALIAAADDYRAGQLDPAKARRAAEGGLLRLYVDRGARMTDVASVLPDPQDRSTAAYLARASAALSGRGIELVVNQFQSYSFPLWQRLRELLVPLYERVGIPADHADAVVFLRDHAIGFGLHSDNAGVFMFVLHGRKRVRLWPQAALAQEPFEYGTHHYTSLLDRAITLEAAAGDVIYWPSSYFHSVEADPGPSLSINVGLRLTHRPAADVLRQIGRATDAGGATVDTVPFPATMLPPIVEAERERVASLASSETIDDELKVAWADRISGAGFIRVPPPLPVEIPPSASARVCGSPRYPALLQRLRNGRWSCSANGRSFSVPYTSCVEQLLARLNTGEPIDVRSLIAAAEPQSAAEHHLLLSILAKLRSHRALALV
jgi:50S ribosomal protein L16 3-hydroxylase